MENYRGSFVVDIKSTDEAKTIQWQAIGEFVFNESEIVEFAFEARGTSFLIYCIYTEAGYYAIDLNSEVCFPVVMYDLTWTSERAVIAYKNLIDGISAAHVICKGFDAYCKRNKNKESKK